MELPPKLSAKFEKLQTGYPQKRSALIPMLMYAQDEFGYISDEMIAEIARRLDLNNVQVEETLAYYSMLRRKPMGRHRTGLHQCGVHAQGRLPSARAREEAAGDRPQRD